MVAAGQLRHGARVAAGPVTEVIGDRLWLTMVVSVAAIS